MAGDPRVRALLEEILRIASHTGGGVPGLPRIAARGPRSLEAPSRARGRGRLVVPDAGIGSGDRSSRRIGRPPQIPGYEVEAVLGRGGMGVVYKARHLRLNRLVALKMLHGRRLRRTARAGAVPARGGGGGEPAPPEHRAGLRRGRPRRLPVFHDGAARRRQPGPGAGGHAAAGRARRPRCWSTLAEAVQAAHQAGSCTAT